MSDTLNLSDILRELHVEAALPALGDHWDESEACFPAAGPRFLDPAAIRQWRKRGGLPAEADAELVEAARLIAARPALLHLAWHCHRLLFDRLDFDRRQIDRWPILDAALGDLSGAFYLLVALDAIPRIDAVHERLGVTGQVHADTCHHYREPVRMYGELHGGHVGVSPNALYWWRNHTRGDLYRLGRLEYMVKPFRGPLRAYRHRASGAVLALADSGALFDGQGLAGADGDPDAWRAWFSASAHQVTGHPIAPTGYGQRGPVTLSLADWEPALAPGDGILEVHIPAGGGMTLERCRDSMSQALDFFPRHFPDRPFRAFACGSWILNPELDRVYRPDSNMVKWQRELYLYPLPSGPRCGMHFVFGREDIDLATAPRDTSMRRALLDHLSSGGRLRAGGMFLLLEDFERFGSQVYREHCP